MNSQLHLAHAIVEGRAYTDQDSAVLRNVELARERSAARAAACGSSGADPGECAPDRPMSRSGRLARMDDQTLRYIDLTRADDGRYQATNRRGGVLPIGRWRRHQLHAGRAAS